MPYFQTFAADAALADMNVSSAQETDPAKLEIMVVRQEVNGPKLPLSLTFRCAARFTEAAA